MIFFASFLWRWLGFTKRVINTFPKLCFRGFLKKHTWRLEDKPTSNFRLKWPNQRIQTHFAIYIVWGGTTRCGLQVRLGNTTGVTILHKVLLFLLSATFVTKGGFSSVFYWLPQDQNWSKQMSDLTNHNKHNNQMNQSELEEWIQRLPSAGKYAIAVRIICPCIWDDLPSLISLL